MSRPWRRTRWRSAVRLFLLARGASLLLSGCPKEPLRILTVASKVLIVPNDVYAEAGSTIRLRAEVLDQNGLGMATNAKITWSGSDTNGNALVFDFLDQKTSRFLVPTPPGLDAAHPTIELKKVRATATDPDIRGSISSDPATLRINYREAPFQNPPPKDRLNILTGASSELPDLFLLDAETEVGDCWWDRVVAVAGRAYLPKGLTTGCGAGSSYLDPGPEISYFSSGAMQFWNKGSLNSPLLWEGNSLKVGGLVTPRGGVGEGFKAPHSPELEVKVHLWNGVRGNNWETGARILSDLARANEILKRSWVGIRLKAVGGIQRLGDGGVVEFEPGKCGNSTYYQDLFPTLAGQPDEDVLQILYVDEINRGWGRYDILPSGDTLSSGKACPWYKGGPAEPTLVVLEMKVFSWGTLAHKVGHILGLNEKALPADREARMRLRARDAWASVKGAWLYLHEFERHHLENFRAQTQLRSGIALAYLGFADDVRTALEEAGARRYRWDVREGLQEILSNHPGIVRFQDGVARGQLMVTPPIPAPVPSMEETAAATRMGMGGGGPMVPYVLPREQPDRRRNRAQIVPLRNHPVILQRCIRSVAADTLPVPGRCREADTGRTEVVLTDGNGIFVFPDLEEGVYEVFPDTVGLGFSEVTPTPGVVLYLLMGPSDTASVSFTIHR